MIVPLWINPFAPSETSFQKTHQHPSTHPQKKATAGCAGKSHLHGGWHLQRSDRLLELEARRFSARRRISKMWRLWKKEDCPPSYYGK